MEAKVSSSSRGKYCPFRTTRPKTVNLHPLYSVSASMEGGHPKRVKTTANRRSRSEFGSSSAQAAREGRGDPYYSLILQETRLAKFQGRKATYVRYVDLTWMAEQHFEFPHEFEAQGAVQFLELKGQVYPALVREFYANFRYKDGSYWSMISGKLFELSEDLFMNVGGLSSNGYGVGDCGWVKETFDAGEVYKSFLRGPHLYIQGELTKAGSLSVENRLLHYLIAYILVQRNANHAQPTVNDLCFMYAVKNNVMINWPEEILKVMYSISTSQSKLLPYSIFISRVVEYLHIDVSDTIIIEYTDKDHLVGESLIHKMGIYKYGNTWKYQEDHTTVDIDLSSDEDQTGTEGQNATAQGEPSGSASQVPGFSLAHLDAMEQRLNNRMDLHFQELKDSYHADLEQCEERLYAYHDNQYQNMRNMVQSSVETQNRFIQTSIQSQSDLFSAEFQKLSMLIRGDQSLAVPEDAAYPPPSQS
ncbi:unnamed protein product [Lupinus luteus]|uniref:Uncharacterized protein n=1 Tax=Lupinus luteus TaxID=3873 RepID=A0AAV1YFN9_LUPLU